MILKSLLSIYIATLTFVWFLFARYIFFHLFIVGLFVFFNLSVSLIKKIYLGYVF